MAPFLGGTFGNPSGGHAVARAAKTALEEARDEVAALLGAEPGEVVFTAGGTEADNLAVKGAARRAARPAVGDAVVTTAFEHKGVLASCDRLGAEGFRVTRLAGPGHGRGRSRRASRPRSTTAPSLVSVMLVNNEVGTIQPLDEIVRARAGAGAGACWSTPMRSRPCRGSTSADAAATADLVAISAPQVRRAEGHRRARRARRRRRSSRCSRVVARSAGCARARPNVAGAVAMAAALRVTRAERDADVARIAALRDRLVDGLLAAGSRRVRERRPRGQGRRQRAPRLPRASRPRRCSSPLDHAGVCAAAGSSCSSGATEPSHVLAAMGIPHRRRAVVDPPEPRLRVHRRRRRRRARGHPRSRRTAARRAAAEAA